MAEDTLGFQFLEDENGEVMANEKVVRDASKKLMEETAFSRAFEPVEPRDARQMDDREDPVDMPDAPEVVEGFDFFL